jgi:7-cyano-7-deazaguanine reductase
MPSQPSKDLQTFPNPSPERDYTIAFDCPEFTCICPLTGQPDFARFTIRYVPDERCVELKSLKLYLWSYRNEGAFHEKMTNRIADDIIRAVEPRSITVEGDWFIRGGIATKVTVSHQKPAAATPVRGGGKAVVRRAAAGKRSARSAAKPAAKPAASRRR